MARRRGHTEEQILAALRQAESGTTVTDICRDVGISEQTFYTWKRKYAGLGRSELRELRQLREENTDLLPAFRPPVQLAHEPLDPPREFR